jgi:hypothetical protein
MFRNLSLPQKNLSKQTPLAPLVRGELYINFCIEVPLIRGI